MNTKIDRSIILTALLLLGSSLLGCSSGLRTEFVEGIVTLDGEPIEGASVTFIPSSAGTARIAIGTTDERGRYTLTTAEGGNPGKGATAGDYKVTVAKRTPDPAWAGGQERPAIERADTSRPPTIEEMAAEDHARKAMAAGLAPPRLYLTPQKYGKPDTSGFTAAVVRGKNRFNFDMVSAGE